MRRDEIRTIIDRVAALVREHYVFPEVGAAVADRLIQPNSTDGTTT